MTPTFCLSGCDDSPWTQRAGVGCGRVLSRLKDMGDMSNVMAEVAPRIVPYTNTFMGIFRMT